MCTGIAMMSVIVRPSRLPGHVAGHAGSDACCVERVGLHTHKNAISCVDVRVSVAIVPDPNGFQMQPEHLSFHPGLRQANLDL